MRAALPGAVPLLLLALAGSAAAASPSPSPSASPPPEDRSTTLTVTPSAAADRAPIVLRGFSDCAVIDGHLLFTTYDGKADNVVVRRTSTAYDYGREKYAFTVPLAVPASAAPGSAKVYAEPFCGPPEEYPVSPTVGFQVERSRLALRLSPRRPDSGAGLRVRVRTCDGARGPLTIRVRAAGSTRDVHATVDGGGSASATVRVAAPGEVSLPFAAAECRGSSYAGPVTYEVRALAPTSPASSPSPSAAAAATPSPLRSEPRPTPSTTGAGAAVPAATSADDRPGPWLGAVAALLVVGTAGAVAAALIRRRSRT